MTLIAAAARAPGKLVLLGEYAVLEGAPAWVAAVDRFAVARARRREGLPRLWAKTAERGAAGTEVAFTYADGCWSAKEPGWELAASAMTLGFGEAAPSLEVDSSAFFVDTPSGRVKVGFGSSAAVTAAILTLGVGDADRSRLFELAWRAHQTAQGGVGSGVDIAAAVYGGALAYRLGETGAECRAAPIPEGLGLLTVWLGEPTSTPRQVRDVLKWKVSARQRFGALVRTMEATAAGGLEAAALGDVSGVIEAARAYGAHMSQLGREAGVPIVTQRAEALADCLGADAAVKPSGAGGGDVALAFVARAQLPALRARAEGAGFRVLEVGFGAPGASIA